MAVFKKAGQFIKKHPWNILLAVLMVAIGAAAIVTLVHENNDIQDNVAQTDRDDIVNEFQPDEYADDSQQDQPDQPTSQAPQPTEPPRGDPNVMGAEDPQPQFITYRNEEFHFEILMPADAVVTTTDNEVKATSASQPGGVYWTVTAFPNTTNETLDSLAKQLGSSTSSVTVTSATVSGQSALKFTSPQLGNATGYAFIYQGWIYYLVGDFSNPAILESFHLF